MTAKISTTSDPGQSPTPAELLAFLGRYCAALLGAGATCIRIEKNAGRIARAYGMTAELLVMPRHVHVGLYDSAGAGCGCLLAAVPHAPISFEVNTRLSRLSWAIADRRTGYAAALREFSSIVGAAAPDQGRVMLLVALANASFCRLFGGDAAAMLIVGIATLAGYCMKIRLLRRGTDMRVVALVCSFVSSVLGATDMLFSIGATPDVALGTSVLYLVPGIPLLNSFSDMLYRHYLCALGRLTDALVLTACLSAGLCAGMILMNAGMF